MKKIVVLGSTGSIGVSTLDVVRQHPDKLSVVGLAAGSNVKLLLEQIAEFAPTLVAIRDESHANITREAYPGLQVYSGVDSAEQLVKCATADAAVAAISGMAGLRPIMAAVERRMDIALANKEALVAAGELLLHKTRAANVKLLPVDSEHSAIWQALRGNRIGDVRRIILTASGGPFFGRSRKELSAVTREQALSHPTWNMGGKISIDSATLMNKGLEVIEAHHLFGLPYDKIGVVVHPQSIIHSIVEYIDGSQIAQLSKPDMRIPIQVALSYPERWESHYVDNDYNLMNWSFHEPDLSTFPSLSLAIKAGKMGGAYPAILNAANEVGVDAFLRGQLAFLGIAEVVEEVLSIGYDGVCASLDDVFAADKWAREQAFSSLRQRVV